MSEPIRSFPCIWPEGYKKTPEHLRIRSQFKQTPDTVQKELRYQLDKLGATLAVISTNAPVKKDGTLYYDAMKRKVSQDPSVAVYFNFQSGQKVLCCDQYNTIWENMYAIARTIENMRAIERWGVSDFIKRSFTGFQELPPSIDKKEDTKEWWMVFGYTVLPPQTIDYYNNTKETYRIDAKRFHTDGTHPDNEKMQELNNAWEQAQKYFGK